MKTYSSVGLFVALLLVFQGRPVAAALQISSAFALSEGNTIGVLFSEPVDPASATAAANYNVSGGLTVSEVVLRPDARGVSIILSGAVSSGISVTVSDVKDVNGNPIVTTTVVPVTSTGLKPVDIGNVVDSATVTAFGAGEVDVVAGGRAIWASEDSFNFVYGERTGDFDVKVQVSRFTSPDNQARAGLMIRENLEPGSKNVDLILYRPERQLWGMTARASTGGATTQPFARGAPVNLPNVWLRMRRIGNELRVHYGTNGIDWTDSFRLAIDFPETVQVGLATMATEGATTERVPVDYRNFGDFVFPDASIRITQQPQNVNLPAGSVPTFSVVAEAVEAPQNEMVFQWQKNEVNIPGAISASFTPAPLTLAENGARFRVILSLPGARVTSEEAVATVFADTIAPQLVSAVTLEEGGTIGVNFSEVLDATSATNADNFKLSGGLSVSEARLRSDQRSVTLVVSGSITSANVILTINGVKDLSGNSIAANTALSLTLLKVKSLDIGDVAEPSLVTAFSAGEFDVLAGGRDIWGTDDSFNFVYQEKSGDFDMKVQVTRFEALANNARASLMLRENLDPGSKNIDLILYPANRQLWGLTFRPEPSVDTKQPFARGVPVNFPNAWLRLRRNGSLITVYYGTNGVTWIDSFKLSAEYPDNVLVGLATVSTRNVFDGQMAVDYRNFSDFTLTNVSIQIVQQPQPVTLPAGATATFAVAAQASGAPQSELVFQWQKHGTNIAGANAASYTTPALTLGDNGAKYGCVISLPGSQVISQEAALTVFQDTIVPQVVSASGMAEGTWIGIAFSETLDGPTATNAANFTLSGGLTISEVTLRSDLRTVVLSLTAPLVSAGANLTVDGIKDLAGNLISRTSIPVRIVPLKAIDVGALAEPSTVIPVGPGEFDVLAGGADIWGTEDSFNFVYQEKTGDFDVKVQVAKFEAIAGTARASLMVRESLDPDSANVDVILYPVARQLWGMTVRTNAGSATIQPFARGVPVNLPNAWMRLSRKGNEVAVFYGTNGITWIDSQKVTVNYPATVLVGLATVSANNTVGGRVPAEYRNFGDFAAAPVLTISRSGAEVAVSWPVAADFTLEQSSNLSPAINWSPVAKPPVSTGSISRVALPIEAGNRFFRLNRL